MRGILIGITGTDGAGKGEYVRGTCARPCQLVCEAHAGMNERQGVLRL